MIFLFLESEEGEADSFLLRVWCVSVDERLFYLSGVVAGVDDWLFCCWVLGSSYRLWVREVGPLVD